MFGQTSLVDSMDLVDSVHLADLVAQLAFSALFGSIGLMGAIVYRD